MQALTLQPPTVFPATFANHPVQVTAGGDSAVDWSDRPGKSSPRALRWRWSAPAVLTFAVPIGFAPWSGAIEDKNIATFSFWVHCGAPFKGKLRFSFGRKGAVDCWFDFWLGFHGWRTAWVAFDRDMCGMPHVDRDFLSVAIIDGPATGDILLDHIIPCALVDRRFHDQDEQIPFINEDAARKDIGLIPLTYYWSQHPAPPAWSVEETDACAADIAEIGRRLDEQLLDGSLGVDEPLLAELFRQAAEWGFGEQTPSRPRATVWSAILFSRIPNHGTLKAPPGYSPIPPMEGVSFIPYIRLMLQVAQAYRMTDRVEWRQRLRRLFLELEEHLTDQGWAAGHATGTMALFGYWALGGYSQAYWLMREELRAAGRQERSARTLAWLFGVGALMETATMKMHIALLDWLYGLIIGRLIAILMMPDRAAGAAWLRQLSDWLAVAVGDNSPGIDDGFKVDGSAFHHGGHYMLYARGAFLYAARMLQVLSRTRFHVDTASHAHFRKALLMTRLFSNLTDWTPSLCGRNPSDTKPSVDAFAWLALAGAPAGDQPVDDEAARAYLRLTAFQSPTALSRKLGDLGFAPEAAPQGHWDMNYGALAIHRRGEWAATAKGHSRYVWSHETYPGENMYGRYGTHGTLFIANGGSPVSAKDSGYSLDGWDWNRWPGTTAIHLPWDQLKADLRVMDIVCGREECLFSDQTLAGGAHFQQRQGVFGLNLHGHAKYCADFRALKSMFFFDNRIICLGSGITHSDTAHPVETTLFQTALPEPGAPLVLNGAPVSAFPWTTIHDSRKPLWLANHLRQGFYVHPGSPVHLQRTRQRSPDHTDSIMTEGDFVTVWLDHGCAPKNGSYAYCVVVDTGPEQMCEWSGAMDSPEMAHYRILQHDHRAHAVHDRATGVSACVVFDARERFCVGPITAVSKPCLLLFRKESDGWQISVCNPNLNLHDGTPPQTEEFTLYATNWLANPSRPDPVEITLDGDFELAAASPEFSGISQHGGRTMISCACRHGLTYYARLRTSCLM